MATKPKHNKPHKRSAQSKSTLRKKQSVLNFPHIPRDYSRIAIIAIFIVMIAFSYIYSNKIDAKNAQFAAIKQEILKGPKNAVSHERMGEYFEHNNDFLNAKYEYNLAQLFGSKGATAGYTRIVQKESAPKKLEQAVGEWERFVAKHPEYRDGWFVIALFWWQLGNRDKASQAISEALALDPQFIPARELLAIIEAKE